MRRARYHAYTLAAMVAWVLLSACNQPETAPGPTPTSKPTPSAPENHTQLGGTWPMADTIATIELENDGETWSLERLGETWILPDHQRWPAEQMFVRTLLRGIDSLAEAEPVGWYPLDGAPFGFTKTNYVDFRDKAGAKLLRITVGGSGDNQGRTYIRINDGPTIYETRAPWFANTHRPTWGSRTCWDVPDTLITEIRWTTSEKTTLYMRKQNDRWQLLTPTDATLSPSFQEHLLPVFARMRSGALLFGNARRFKGKTPIARCTITAAETNMHLTVYQSEEGDWLEGYREGNPVVFVFDKRLLQLPQTVLSNP